MTRTIKSSAASESWSRCVMKVPPVRPRRASTRPVASSSRSACWMVGRPTPNIPASSRSAGKASPGLISRSAMWRRICSATYSCARTWRIRSKRRPLATSAPLVLTATRTLRRQPGDRSNEPVEQALAPAADLRRETVCLFKQRVGIDPVTVELVSVCLDPALHDFGRHFGMKLQTEAASDYVRLRSDVRFGDELRARRQREAVEVPVEPRPLGYKLGIFCPYR